MAAKRKAKPVKRKTKRAGAKRAAKPAKRTTKPASAKRPAKPKRVTPRRSPDTSTAVTAAHRAFDPEATQQLSFTEVLGDIEESMALNKLKEDA